MSKPETMMIDDIKYVREDSIINSENYVNIDANTPYIVGRNYIIRTVTHIHVGKLVSVGEKELVLENASWVADTKRFHNMLKDGLNDQAEIEPFTMPVIVGRGAIIDCQEYMHELPTEQQ